MNLTEGKAKIDAGHTLVLDIRAHWKYIGANYQAWKDELGRYTWNVHYDGERLRRRPYFFSIDWDDFFYHLTPILQQNEEWQVL